MSKTWCQNLPNIQGGSNMTGTSAACLHTNQSRSYLNHPVLLWNWGLRKKWSDSDSCTYSTPNL